MEVRRTKSLRCRVALLVSLLAIVAAIVCHEAEAISSNHIYLPSRKSGIEVEEENNRPLIGIVTHPGDGARGRLRNDSDVSYIAASYVKLVEAGGARVVPFIYNEAPEILEQKFQAVNGLLFTGGSDKYGPLHKTVAKLLKRALEENDKGEYFPVFAICLGFEIVSMVIGNDLDLLEQFDALSNPATLNFTSVSAQNSSIFKWFPPHLLSEASSEPIYMESHRFGISPERMLQNKDLSSFFKILTTTNDRNNKAYVSTVEAYNYPVVGVQWHPEKNAFEWQKKSYPHNANAIQVTQSAANFVVSEARKSNHRPVTLQQEKDYLIYNYNPVYAAKQKASYDQIYLFP